MRDRLTFRTYSSRVITLVVATCLFSACATVNENPRSKMSSGEGRYEFSATPELSRDQIYDAVMDWVAANYASLQEVKQLHKKDSKGVLLKSLAPVSVNGKQRHVVYTLTIKAFPKKVRLEFVTGPFNDGMYPAADSLPRVERYYRKIQDEILKPMNIAAAPAAKAEPPKAAPAAPAKKEEPSAASAGPVPSAVGAVPSAGPSAGPAPSRPNATPTQSAAPAKSPASRKTKNASAKH